MILNNDLYTKAWNFAADWHKKKLTPGTSVSYLRHIGSVVMEAMSCIVSEPAVTRPDLLVQVAILHDILEDTAVKFSEISETFGTEIAISVLSLTKDATVYDKKDQMIKSLASIELRRPEVMMVKMCDRIVNLQRPPGFWSINRMVEYRDESCEILRRLKHASPYLAKRLSNKIEEYGQYCIPKEN